MTATGIAENSVGCWVAIFSEAVSTNSLPSQHNQTDPANSRRSFTPDCQHAIPSPHLKAHFLACKSHLRSITRTPYTASKRDERQAFWEIHY